MKCKDGKKCEKSKDDDIEWCKTCKACKKRSDNCKESNKIYEDCTHYPEYEEVGKKQFIFDCEKCEKKMAILSKYHLSKFPDLFNFYKKDLEKFALLLRKGVLCSEYIHSWENV